MFQRQKVVVKEGMREARHVSGDKHIVGDNGIDVEGTASRVTADPKGAYRQPGIVQPFRIPHRSQRHDRHLSVEATAISRPSASPSREVTVS
jgi:hypothetical protein